MYPNSRPRHDCDELLPEINKFVSDNKYIFIEKFPKDIYLNKDIFIKEINKNLYLKFKITFFKINIYICNIYINIFKVL